MFVKIMSGENLPDSNPFKLYTMLETTKASFSRDTEGKLVVTVLVHELSSSGNGYASTTTNSITCDGNVYLLNDQGKTLDSIGCKN